MSLNIILACCETENKNIYGIGYEGKIPWNCKKDQKLFKDLTTNNIVIVGRKTYDTLPDLKNREIYVVSKNISKVKENKNLTNSHATVYGDLHEAINHGLQEGLDEGKEIFIAGGGMIYLQVFSEDFLKHFSKYKIILHLSLIPGTFKCDTFVYLQRENWCIQEEKDEKDFLYTKMIADLQGEKQYLDILKELINTRDTIERNGRNGKVYSRFFKTMSFDLTKGFPLLTTKKMFIRGVLEELFLFLQGLTDTKILENKGVNIWKGNTSREFLDKIGKSERDEGIMGPMYGYQWRFFGAEYDEKMHGPCLQNEEKDTHSYDQLENIIKKIKTDPDSRRIMMTSFNPLQADDGVLYPCHSIVLQFYVDGKFLDMSCYNRSQDMFLGVPFNISSAGFLLMIISKITGLFPRMLNMVLGDYHVYTKHLEQTKEQISRQRYVFPTVSILKNLETIKDIEKLCVEDFSIKDYKSHEKIHAEMIA